MRHKKHSLSISIGTLAALLLASCSQSDSLPLNNETDVPADGIATLHITSATLQISQDQPSTRANNTNKLTAGSIGVFRSMGTGYAEAQKNKQYTYNGGSVSWQPQTADQTVYLMAKPANVCAYYPYNSTYNDMQALPLTSGKYKGTAENNWYDGDDLCYASNRTMNGARPSTNFVMNHTMARVEIRLRRSDSNGDPRKLTSISIDNAALVRTATFNMSDGSYNNIVNGMLTWTPGANDLDGIDLPANDISSPTSVLLVPRTFTSSTSFSFTVDGKKMSIQVPSTILSSLEAGKLFKLIFDIKASTINLLQLNIIDWQPGEWESAGDPNLDGSPKDYIELGGVKWALSNLKYNDIYHNYSFTSSNFMEGTKLQWNALTNTDSGNATGIWISNSDPCSRLEPKGNWTSPTKENFEALKTLPNVWTAGYKGMNGRWFGTDDAKEAVLHSGNNLFLPAAKDLSASYWTKTYFRKPMAFIIFSNKQSELTATTYSTPCLIRCVKVEKP